MTIKAIPINTAKQVGQAADATRVVILAVDAAGHFCVTSWGRTRADCRAAAQFSEGRLADLTIEGLAEAGGRST